MNLRPRNDQASLGRRLRYQSGMAEYDPLRDHLEANGSALITLSFATIARIVGGLPQSATDYRAWWSNERGSTRHVQSRAWTDAGYVAEPDLANQLVQFRRS